MTESTNVEDDMRPEDDLASLKGGVRGKYYERIKTEGFKIVLLDPDVKQMLRTDEGDNRVLHPPIEIAERENGGDSTQDSGITDATP